MPSQGMRMAKAAMGPMIANRTRRSGTARLGTGRTSFASRETRSSVLIADPPRQSLKAAVDADLHGGFGHAGFLRRFGVGEPGDLDVLQQGALALGQFGHQPVEIPA